MELLVALFEDDEVLLAYHNARPITKAGKPLPLLDRGRTEKRYPALAIDPWFNPLGFTQMFRSSLVGLEEYWPQSKDQNQEGERLAHDQWYLLLASAFGSIVYLPDVLADYRQHGANAYGVSWYRMFAPQLNELWHATHAGRRRLEAAEGRARIFRQISQGKSEEARERTIRAASWYDHLAEFIRTRLEVYDSSSLTNRASALTQLVRARGYGAAPPQYSRLALAMDATVGVTGLFPLIEKVTRRLARR